MDFSWQHFYTRWQWNFIIIIILPVNILAASSDYYLIKIKTLGSFDLLRDNHGGGGGLVDYHGIITRRRRENFIRNTVFWLEGGGQNTTNISREGWEVQFAKIYIM